MNKRILLFLVSFFLLAISCNQKPKEIAENSKIEDARKKHELFLENNPFKKVFNLSKAERKAAGLPPNKYFEQEWLLEMNPYIGRPTPENISQIRKDMEYDKLLAATMRIPGDGTDNSWVERGPNNVGGRTRALIFDPTDTNTADGITVIAGGVSGGLWKNTNIASAASSWTKMPLPEHLNVQNITIDPNNTNIWYVGTGESYVFGDVNGNGVWKTLDAGLSWFQVFGGGTLTSVNHQIQRLQIITPSNATVIGNYTTGLAGFGNTPISPITAPIALVNDGVAPTEDACSALPANSMSGKIALIRRGSCSFESKVVMAENAGAVAAIIMNNAAGAGVFTMSGDGSGATIPAIMVSKEDGDLLMANLTNLTGTINPPIQGEFSGLEVQGVQVVNDVVTRNNAGTTEIFVALGDGYYGGIGANTYFSPTTFGVYKSTNGGETWTKATFPLTPNGNAICPNDIEIGTDGRVWVSSTNSWTYGDGGGRVFRSTDGGTTFTLVHTVTGNGGGARVELEASNTNPDKFYILSELSQANASSPTIEVKLEMTTNGFGTVSSVTLPPASGESRLTTYGFTGAQAFYDLVLESDPSNDAVIVAGGINLAKSTNSGSSWTQISNWSSANLVHSDQHAIVFNPNNPTTVLFGNDGGIYYCPNLSLATGTTANITSRNTGFNVTQFVGLAVAPLGQSGTSGDFFVAGAQDNGSNYFAAGTTSNTGATAGINPSIEVQGGDGGIPLASQDGDKYYITNYVYNQSMNRRGIGGAYSTKSLETTQAGMFYPAMALDSNQDIVYSEFYDYGTGAIQIRRISNFLGGAPASRTSLTNALLTGIPTALTVSPYTTASSKLFVGTINSKLLRVTNANGTPTWTDISGPNFIGSVSDIEFGANENQIFVTFHNYGVTNVWYTPNGGTNWFNIEGNLPDLPVKCFIQNPLASNELMIGTDLGVWYANTFDPSATNDQALVWRPSYNGMSNVKVTDMDIQKDLNNPGKFSVFAATYGRGVFSADFWYCGATTTTWNGSSWSNGVPSPKTAVVFAGNYNSTASLDACSVVINTGTNVVFNSGHTLRVGDNITVNGTGTLTIENNAALIQYAKHAVNTGNIIVKRNSAPMVRLDYTAWSSPVQGQQLLAFSPNTLPNRFYEYLYTGTTTPTAYQTVDPTTNFITAKGYIIRVDNNWSASTPAPYNGVFTGVPNNGICTYPIGKGFNVVGNPYASPINADEFIQKNAKVRALYYWTHTAPAVGGVYPVNNFASYTLLGGVAAAAGGATPNNIIQVGQGFYVSSLDAFSVEFNNEMRRDAISSTQFFRASTTTNQEKHRIWLNLNASNHPINQILIGYMNGATNNVDSSIDGLTLEDSNSKLYNLINSKAYVIQGRSMPFTDQDVVPLGFMANEPDTYTIALENFDGLFDAQDIFLKDKMTNVIHDLKSGGYQFSSQAGIFDNRFEIVYKNSALNTTDFDTETTINVFTNQNGINIQSSSFINEIIVYDILGKVLLNSKNINSRAYTNASILRSNQALIVKVIDQNGKMVTKKIVY
ncbi:PA domain-containing protein [Flavobacterium sp. J27]|uniref:PA domain-containing protein n=1 Tax=Flavobacterium sp. J27 TaxID=2060419 RepID=UPI0010319536|nr:PA domain-containing protein [Flavobacterium sp. J27]